MTVKLEWYKPGFLKELRTRTRMTQPKLGELSGFSRDDIANFERGASRMAHDDALKIYEALATVDVTGVAAAAAGAAAAKQREFMQDLLERAERELKGGMARLQKNVEVARTRLAEAETNEKRVKALKPPVALRVLSGASPEGLQGIKRQLEAEIRALEHGTKRRQLEKELAQIKQRIRENKEFFKEGD